MPVLLSHKEVVQQSENVYNQFGESKWIPNCKWNNRLQRGNIEDLKNVGIGKFLALVAMGASLEKDLEVLKKYRDRVDVVVCDKGFIPLLEHGVKADYVMICDAGVPADNIKGHFDKTKDVTLISTCYGNPDWTSFWQGKKYFYVNRDSIMSERVFMRIMGQDTRMIPAGSNVSNAMLIFFTGCDNDSAVNWSGYEKFFLIGYDYSWRPDGNYYAWKNPVPKRNYMNHRTMIDVKGDVCFTSENLLFSAKWLYSYITTFNLPVVNCSNRGLLNVKMGSLENELKKINPDPRVRDHVRELFRAANLAHISANHAAAIFEKSRRTLSWY